MLAVTTGSHRDRRVTRRLNFKHGIRLRLAGAPEQVVSDGAQVQEVAILGDDFPGLRPRIDVSEGDTLQAGQVLLCDRKRPLIKFVTPVSGQVVRIERGARRSLSRIVIAVDHSLSSQQVQQPFGPLKETLLARGLWPAFRSRPFGRIPAPDAVPDAIVVSATDSHPLCPDPNVVLADELELFRKGVVALTDLTEGDVFVCQPPSAGLVDTADRIVPVDVTGPYPSGQVGAQVQQLVPAALDRVVWTIDAQDVVAIGHLLETGLYRAERIVALSGPMVKHPRLVPTVMGARLEDVLRDGLHDGKSVVLSGSPLAGRRGLYLGRYHRQVTALAPEASKPVSSLRPIVPTRALEQALPFEIPPLPLMRALSVGDSAAADQLGCRALIEEDVAALTALCGSGSDYGRLLRDVLDELEQGA